MSLELESVGAQLSFALYGAANRVFRLHKPFLEPLGLTFPQYLVILDLLNGSPRTVGELGSRLGMDNGTLTPLLKRMEQRGWLSRRRATHDERSVIATLLPAGRVLEQQAQEIPTKLGSCFDMSVEQIGELRQHLQPLIAQLTK